jgi:hypothetical protein
MPIDKDANNVSSLLVSYPDTILFATSETAGKATVTSWKDYNTRTWHKVSPSN